MWIYSFILDTRREKKTNLQILMTAMRHLETKLRISTFKIIFVYIEQFCVYICRMHKHFSLK